MFPRMAIVLALIVAALAAPALRAADVPRGAPVGVGDTAPDFTLDDQNGRPVTLSAELKKQPVVLIFYRGHW